MNVAFLSSRITSDITRFGTETKGGVSSTLVTSRPVITDGQVQKGANGYTEIYDQLHTVKAFGGLGNSVANHKKNGEKLIVNGEIRYGRTEKDGRTFYNPTSSPTRSNLPELTGITITNPRWSIAFAGRHSFTRIRRSQHMSPTPW